MNSKTQKAIKQLRAIEKLEKEPMRLAAEWDEKWKVLISTILSAQTRDELTIKISEIIYKKYPSAKKLGNAKLKDIQKIIRPINFYKTKSKNIKKTARMISENGIPKTLDGLMKFPGVGRKVGNVYLAEAGVDAIGVDTHLSYISKKLGWTNNHNPHKIEKDLESLFPRKYWRSLNNICVRFGRSYNRKNQNAILKKIRKKN